MTDSRSYAQKFDVMGRLVQVHEGDEMRHICGCVTRVIGGKWEVVQVCVGGQRQGVHAFVKGNSK